MKTSSRPVSTNGSDAILACVKPNYDAMRRDSEPIVSTRALSREERTLARHLSAVSSCSSVLQHRAHRR